MAEACPSPALLARLAVLSSPEREGLERHLADCLSCAEVLERNTRAELDQLIGARRLAAPPIHSPVLDTVMQGAQREEPSLRLDPEQVLQVLDPPLTPGALGTFAGYDVLAIAGHGGMGVVLKARDRTLDRVVAVKVLFPRHAQDKTLADRFLEEARAVAAIHDDHIVAVHHAGTAHGLPYLVMPFHAEGTLEQWLARSPKLTPREVARVGWQLARALAATHARGLLHRDLKPSNVLLEDGLERVRLADFGLARPVSAHPPATKPGGEPAEKPEMMVAGTPHYMSPEQARGEAIDARSDLFGLGAVLFRLLTARTLYAEGSSREVLRSAGRCELAPVRRTAPEVPAALASILDRLLARRVADRFESAQAVETQLAKLVQLESPWRRWSRRTAIGGLAACLTSSAAVVALDWSGATAILNSLACWRTGHGYYLRGQFGTYTQLREAVAASRGGDLIEVRFSGERLTDGFRLENKPLTIRAARGFTPTLVATNNGQPFILADGPLMLEGLTLVRRTDRFNFSPLVLAEHAPVQLLNCRFLRVNGEGEEVLVRGGRLLADEQDPRIHRPLVVLVSGGMVGLRNCLLLGRHVTGVGVRGSSAELARVEIDNSLFVLHRAFAVRTVAPVTVQLASARSMFVVTTLLDLDSGAIGQFAANWADSVFDRSGGPLLRMNRFTDSTMFQRVDWKETNMVYAGQGPFVSDRRRAQIALEAEWNSLLRLPSLSHRVTERRLLAETTVRSSARLNGADVSATGLGLGGTNVGRFFQPWFVGPGAAYSQFSRHPDYLQWRNDVWTALRAWHASRDARSGEADPDPADF